MGESIVSPKQMSADEVLGRFAEWYRMMREAGLSFDDLQRPIDDQEFRRKLVDFWKSGSGKRMNASANPFFPVTVDHALSLKDMIAAGKYDYVNPDITEKRFPVKGSGKSEVEVELVHYNKLMTSDQVLTDFKERGLKPAPIEVGLALAKEKPDLQRQFPIVMLGSVWQVWYGYRGVPFLDGWSVGERSLDLFWCEDGWDEDYRFLAVCEV